MAFDPNQQGIPTPNINPEPQPAPTSPASVGEQQVRTMRADLGAPVPPAGGGLPSFDAEEPAFTPETTNQIPSVDQIVSEGGTKKPFWIIGAVAGFLVLAAVGYFVVAPMFNKTTTPETPAVVTPTPPGTQPLVINPPVNPPEAGKPVAVHKTQFINPPVATVTEKLVGMTQADIKGAMVRIGQTASQGLTEIVFTDTSGTPVSLGAIMSALGVATTDFTADATVFIFKDDKGIWPGYIGEGNTAGVTTLIEGNKMLASLFIVNPGTLSAFKGGTINNLPDRYAPGSTVGASLGYLVKNNKLLISTSFPGMKEALRLMGL